MSSGSFGIGEVATISGKEPSAIRYYESIGLLPEPVRMSGRRRYPEEVLRSLAVIDTAQRAGLSLDDIRLLLRASTEDAKAVEQLREVAERRLPILREAIVRAELVRKWFEQAETCPFVRPALAATRAPVQPRLIEADQSASGETTGRPSSNL